METNYWLRRNTRVTRRNALRGSGIAVAGLVGMTAVGCGDDDDDTSEPTGGSPAAGTSPTSAPTAQQPVSGGVLEFSLDNINPNIDIHTVSSTTQVLLWSNISHHLIGLDPFKGGFADTEATKSMESPDTTTMIFKLWPGMTWHQTQDATARPFTADDVVYSIKRIATNDPAFPKRSLFESIDSITATDPTTVVIKTKKPNVALLTYLGTGQSLMVNKDVVEKFGKIDRVSACSGIGPFTLQSFDAAGVSVLKKNPSYFRPGFPYLDGVNIHAIADAQSQLAAFRTGKLHVFAGTGGMPLEAEEEIKSSVKNVQLLPWSGTTIAGSIGLNFKVKPFDDMRVRQAVHLVADRHALMAQGYQNKRTKMKAPVPWAFGDFGLTQDELNQLPGYRKDKTADFAQAKALLAAAGLKPEDIQVETITSSSAGPETYETIIPQLKAFGFKIELKVVEATAFSNANSKKDFGWIWQSGTSEPEVDSLLRLFNYTGGSRNYNSYSDVETDKMIDQQAQEFDRAKRAAITKAISRRLIEQPNLVYTAGKDNLFGAQANVRDYRVADLQATSIGTDLTRTWLAPKS